MFRQLCIKFCYVGIGPPRAHKQSRAGCCALCGEQLPRYRNHRHERAVGPVRAHLDSGRPKRALVGQGRGETNQTSGEL